MQLAAIWRFGSCRSGSKKIVRVMKITAILLLSASLAVSAHGYSQRITISEKNVSLQSIFEKIEKQTDYTFAYAVSQLSGAKKVSIDIVNGTLDEVLQI